MILTFVGVGVVTSFAYRTFQGKWVSLRNAQHLQKQGLYEKASQQYFSAIRKGAPEEMVVDDILYLYKSTGRNELVKRFKGFICEEKGEKVGPILEMIADAEYSMGDFMESSRTYALAVEANPGRKNLHVKHARSLFFGGQPEEAVKSYQLFLMKRR